MAGSDRDGRRGGAGLRGMLSRGWLLSGVSVVALGAGAGFTGAHAGQPPLFSPQWLAQRGQALRNSAAAGSGSGTSVGAGLPTSAGGAAGVQAQVARSMLNLSQMAASLRQARGMQAAATATALATPDTSVPNGLVAGGLQVAPGAVTPGSTLWIGANQPSQTTTATGGASVTVTQTQQQALLTWQTFNVGASTTLNFDQTTNSAGNGANWVALNKVSDPAAKPSQILGAINAPGKVFIINQNGILFGAGAQVNVNSLVASAADLPVTISQSGTVPSVDFSLYGAQSGSSFAPSFLGAPVDSVVSVAAGARITTAPPASATSGGGYVMLLGGTALNAGAITTPSGQTVLASGQDFILRAGYSTTGNQTATTRGSQVATVGLAGGTDNTGILSATDGDITLVGHDVVQGGIALATTSVNVRGTVHLLSDTADTTATITLSPGSVTAVQPDDSPTTALDSQREQLITQSTSLNALRLIAPSATNPQLNDVGTLSDRLDLSRIEIVTGGAVAFGAGSLTMSQGGQVSVQAAGRVQAASNAAIDVSGQLGVTLPMSANDLVINIQSYEQRDAPVNRLAGGLDNDNVTVDIRDLVLVPASTLYPTDRYYTPGGLLEVSGYLNTTGHTIGEWTTVGGTITLAGGSVVTQTNASFNISGGSVTYAAGVTGNSYLIGPGGNLFNVNTAPADLQYTGVYTGFVADHPRWGVSATFTSPLIAPATTEQAGYTVGRDAGSLVLSAPTVIFEGSVTGTVVNGPYQTTARPATVGDGYTLGQTVVAMPGTIELGQYNASGLVGAFKTAVLFSDSIPGVADQLAVDTPIPADRLDTAEFSSAALDGLGGVSVASRFGVRVLDSITLAPGASLSLTAPTVDIVGNISVPSGTVAASDILTISGTPTVLGAADKGVLLLRRDATISTAGLWTDAQSDPTQLTDLAFINGGTVSFDSAGALALAKGSVIDVSSGGALLANGATSDARGGGVTLIGDDPTVGNATAPVVLAGTITSYGVTGGGAFKLVAPKVLIAETDTARNALVPWLGPAFFDSGFTSYDVTSLAGLKIADNTVIEAAAPVYRYGDTSDTVPTGGDPRDALQLWLPPLYIQDPANARLIQRQGVSLLLRADANVGTNAARGGSVELGTGAVLAVDPGQTVRLEAYDEIVVNGTISAPGGQISIVNTRQENPNNNLPSLFIPGLSVWLGATSVLDASGQASTALDRFGQPYGVVGVGGTITIGADGGAGPSGTVLSSDALVIIRPGAVVEASGASAVIDPGAGGETPLGSTVLGAGVPVPLATAGGTIALSSYNGIYVDGSLQAMSGGAGALGGTLSMTLETPLFSLNATPPDIWNRLPRRILVSQDTTSDLSATLRPEQPTPLEARGEGRISVAQITGGGFATVSLFARDLIEFQGDVSLSVAGGVTLYQGIIAETEPAARVSISAPYVLLSGYTSPNLDLAVPGITINGTAWQPNSADTTAVLSINADLIDVVNDLRFGVASAFATNGTTTDGQPNTVPVAVGGFATIDLVSGGDIRFGTSTFVTPGSVTLTAAQIYPTTEANAQIYAGVQYYGATNTNVYAPGQAITVTWNGVTEPVPYSVDGSLLLAAPTVEQDGIVRAPEGIITLGAIQGVPIGAPSNQFTFVSLVTLGAGSLTSVSLDGQSVPFGGTADGETYTYNGAEVTAFTPGIGLAAQSIVVAPGATLDIGGGGELTGAGFISGRGGSVNTLLAPLPTFSASGAGSATLATNPVYAIVPGAVGTYAPTTPLDQSASYQGSVPTVGARITIAAGVPGLPAGTYTLLPSYYALLPGGFRVQLDTTSSTALAGATALPDGSYLVGGYRGTANTTQLAALPVPVTLTPGSVARSYSQYDEESYSQFQIGVAAQTGAPRASIPADAKTLTLQYPAISYGQPAFTYDGVSLVAPAAGGFGGTVFVEGGSGNLLPNFEITAAGATPTTGYVSIAAADLDALGASRLVIGGSAALTSSGGAPTLSFTGLSSSVVIRDGAALTVPEVFLVSASNVTGATGAITVATGATIDTIGAGAPPYDSTGGYYYNSSGYSVVAVSNGALDFTPDVSASQFFGPITVRDGATLYAAGTLTFSTTQALTLGPKANFGAPNITLDVASVNILSPTVQAALAEQAAAGAGSVPAITLPTGLQLDQDVLNRLIEGNPSAGVPPLVQLTLTATQSVNLFGGVTLSTAGGGLRQLVLNTPAIYGWSDLGIGGTSDVAAISTGAGALVWNGIATTNAAGTAVSAPPGGFASTGLATGSGTLELSASQIVLGYPAVAQVNNQLSLGRGILGFAEVDLTATQQIIGNNQGALTVYQLPGASYGQPGYGGNLILTTPLLTGQAGAITTLTAGGTLTLVSSPSTSASVAGGLGAEIDLTGQQVTLGSTVALPGGRFVVTARGGIALNAGATLDLAGPSTGFFDQTEDGPGGTVILQTTAAGVTQVAGSTIDVSAGHASAGSLSVTALGGTVALAGTILGGGGTPGSIDVRAATIDNFSGLNESLTQGGVTGSRSFEQRYGDLTVGDEVVANVASITLDDGNLTITGTIAASGATPGTIDLTASGTLTLASGALLDAHATVLHTDSYGAPIDAENTPSVTLTSSRGSLELQSGVTIDVSSADGVARGEVTLNAPRVGDDDIAISAAGPLTINGVWTGTGAPAGSVAVYGWRTYTIAPDPVSGTALVTQATLDSINATDTLPFMIAATANTALQSRLAGLQAAAQGAFHLRPGVELDSGALDGSMAVAGDINLANYRYGPLANEPGALVLRASGNLSINGSITDGFGAPVDGTGSHTNPDDRGWVLYDFESEPFGADVVLPVSLAKPVTLAAGTTFPNTTPVALNYPITIDEGIIYSGVVMPAPVTLAPAEDTGINDYVIPAGGWVATAPITNASGQVIYKTGAVIPGGATLQAGWTLGTGSVLPFEINVPAGTVWPAGASLASFDSQQGVYPITLENDTPLQGGAFIPSGTVITFSNFAEWVQLRQTVNGQQGQIWATAPMLPAGGMSWNIGLVGGADTSAASQTAVQPANVLAGTGNLILSDLHYTAPASGSPLPSFSVIRTGTGNLSLTAGGDITEYSLFGIYTAGTQTPTPVQFDLAQARSSDGTVLGKQYNGTYNRYVEDYQAYYPTGGGNVTVTAQGGIYGDTYDSPTSTVPATDWVGDWLWRQGDGANQPTAWWINFGTYVLPLGNNGSPLSSQPQLEGFVGIGTLGGGDLTLTAGGDAGVTVARDSTQRSQGLVLAVASTGQVTGVNYDGGVVVGGTLEQTGGGTLTVSVGGALNGLAGQPTNGLGGTFTDLRGTLTVSAGSLGQVVYQYGTVDPVDTRPQSPYTATIATETGGIEVVPGDATVNITTLRDLVLAGAGDAGRLPTQDLPGFLYTDENGIPRTAPSGGISSFSLWTANTAIDLYSAGGNLTPTTQPLFGSLASVVANDMPTDNRFLYPPTLNAVAASGGIYYGTIQTQGNATEYSLELAPAPEGQLQLLANGSIYAAGYGIDMSGANADANALANPFRPEYNSSAQILGTTVGGSNAFAGAAGVYALFAFGADTPTSDLHADDTQPARIYAGGDIVDAHFGEILNYADSSGVTPSTWYIAAKPTWMLAGEDIVAAGTRPDLPPSSVGESVFTSYPNEASTANPSATTSGNLFLNDGDNDISMVSAGRDILSSYFYVAGPGALDVTAGRNLDQLNTGLLKSLGPVYGITSRTRDGGAGITVLAGAGAAGMDVTDFARLYFAGGNIANPAFALDAPPNQGKVTQSYADALLAWLRQTFDYAGTQADALATFLTLPEAQQQAFVRTVFFEELLASGREETDPSSPHYHSYLRGKDAIATLFPATTASGTPITYQGDVTMFSGTVAQANNAVITDPATGQPVVFDAGISTQFGGDIQLLVPGGSILLGVGGAVAPGGNTGLVTFGSGAIESYSLGSVLLGQSRIFTTFGGAIQIWSATGDINAGIGTKTSVVYQPPSITYDDVGGLTLAPTAPTNGAGIATLTSIPGVPPGDVDLVAPEGTIDAGEAGIRVSGNLTLAALAVVNAANLQVSGTTVGAPTVAVPNFGALNAANAVAGAAQNSAQALDEARRKRQAATASIITVEVLGYGE